MENLFYAKQVYDTLRYKDRGNINNKNAGYIRWCKIHIENKFIPDIDYVKIEPASGKKCDTDYIISTGILETLKLTLIKHCPQHGVLDRLNDLLNPKKTLELNEDSSIEYSDYEIFDKIQYDIKEPDDSEFIPEPIDLGDGITLHHKDDIRIYGGTIYGNVWDKEDIPDFNEFEEIK